MNTFKSIVKTITPPKIRNIAISTGIFGIFIVVIIFFIFPAKLWMNIPVDN
jgi:hypothetical protein